MKIQEAIDKAFDECQKDIIGKHTSGEIDLNENKIFIDRKTLIRHVIRNLQYARKTTNIPALTIKRVENIINDLLDYHFEVRF
jgi:hypothetical protein